MSAANMCAAESLVVKAKSFKIKIYSKKFVVGERKRKKLNATIVAVKEGRILGSDPSIRKYSNMDDLKAVLNIECVVHPSI